MAVAGLPAIAFGQEFQYSNAWHVSPYAAAAYGPPTIASGYVMPPQLAPGYLNADSFAGNPSPYVGAPAGACCGDGCDHCCSTHCRTGRCLHRSGIFGEYLYWQASGIDLSYAVPQNGIGGVGTVQVGDVAVLDFDYESAFRAGFTVALDCLSSVSTMYTRFQTSTQSDISIDAPFVILPLVTHPGTFNAGATSQAAAAGYSLSLDTIDLEYRAVLISGSKYYVNYVVGARYAELDQSFDSIFPFAPPDGTTTVSTELDFTGAGIRIGLEGERSILRKWGVCFYGKAMGSLLGGESRASYLQANQFNGIEAFTAWEDARLVPIAEAELGLSWMNRSGMVRLSAGYYLGAWMNMVTTQEWIDAVQAVNFTDVGQDAYDSIRFDGLVARAEIRI
jgi:hypothetical protein